MNHIDLKHITNQLLAWCKRNAVIIIVIIAATASFFLGASLDTSVEVSGSGWADQELYLSTINTIKSGSLPTQHQMHFPVGYPILGVLGSIFTDQLPFLLISFLLFIGTVWFVYTGSVMLIGRWWAVLVTALVLVWDGVARTLHTITEVFIVPWNNQVAIFLFALFFWLLAGIGTKKFGKSTKHLVIASLVAGYSVATREDLLLFAPLLLLVYVFAARYGKKDIVIAGLVFSLAVLPQVVAKYNAFGSLGESGHDYDYSVTLKDKYFKADNLVKNTREVLIDSASYTEDTPSRKALFQESPWLWLSVVGLIFMLASRSIPITIKLYTGISLLAVVFYLSGVNMSAQKLAYHCIRYIAPALIVLNFLSVYSMKCIYDSIKDSVGVKHDQKHQ